EQPPLVDGIHLRWAFKPDLGFPWHGFYLFRRAHLPGDPVCLSQVVTSGPPPGPRPRDTLHTPHGRITSDRNPLLTADFQPSGSVEFDLSGRRHLRFSFGEPDLARRVEVRVGFRANADIEVTALLWNTPINQSVLSGSAGTVTTVTLEFDAITAVEFGP